MSRVSVAQAAHPTMLLAFRPVPQPHPTRTRILDHLHVLPGDHLRSIARTLHISLGEARYHLHVLHRGGLVHESKVRHRARYYAVEQGAQADRNILFEKHWEHRDVRSRVFHTVKAQGQVGPSQVARHMGISRQLATYHLGRLAASGQLTREDGQYRADAVSLGGATPGTADLSPDFRR